MSLFSAVISFAVGVAVLSVNPRRLANILFAVISIVLAIWFIIIYGGVQAGYIFITRDASGVGPVPWLKANAGLSAFFPWLIWILHEAVGTSQSIGRIFNRSIPWLLVGIVLAVIPFTDSFIPIDSTPKAQKRGPGYVVFYAALIAMHLLVVIGGYAKARECSGMRRIETQFLVLNVGMTWVITLLLTLVGNLADLSIFKRSVFFMFIASNALIAWAIAVPRIIDARQAFSVLAHRTIIIVVCCAGSFALFQLGLFNGFLPAPFDLLLYLAVSSVAALWLMEKVRNWSPGGQLSIERIRAAVIAVARTEPNVRGLISQFERILCESCQTTSAQLIFDWSDSGTMPEYRRLEEIQEYLSLCKDGWATPESLERRRMEGAVAALHHFMVEKSIGLIVVAPRGSMDPSLAAILGAKRDQAPFTYDESNGVRSVVELMDNIVTRSRMLEGAALEAKVEHLALMSRGLAHDLKNLMTPISSFLIHTEGRFPGEAVVEEVHAAAKKSMNVMTDYVRDALFFARQLTLKLEACEVGQLLESVREITSGRAKSRQVLVILQSESNLRFVADIALCRRLLTNLVANAIDASVPGARVVVNAIGSDGKMRFQVTDSGCGIPPEHLARVFEPYFTTKQFGEDVRGFGLGLTICQKIAHLHGGTIAIQSKVDHGTTVNVEFPTQEVASTGRGDELCKPTAEDQRANFEAR